MDLEPSLSPERSEKALWRAGGRKILLAEGWGKHFRQGEGSEEGPVRWTVRTATDATASSALPCSP